MTANDLALMGITAESVAGVFSWGLAAVLAMWATGYAVGIGITVIRKV